MIIISNENIAYFTDLLASTSSKHYRAESVSVEGHGRGGGDNVSKVYRGTVPICVGGVQIIPAPSYK